MEQLDPVNKDNEKKPRQTNTQEEKLSRRDGHGVDFIVLKYGGDTYHHHELRTEQE